MDGSAAVIGEMMLPILDPTDPAARAPARDLGIAFQLTNFLRDVGEDLDRGRVYIPQKDLDRFGVDPHDRVVDDAWCALMEFEIAWTRSLYLSADEGIAMLPPRSARSIGSARVLYSGILDRIVANRYDVFTRRARVSTVRKLATVAAAFARPVAVTIIAFGPLPQFRGHDRQQEAIGLAPVRVMHVVRPTNPAKVSARSDRSTPAAVDAEIVDHQVGGSVRRDTCADPEQGP